VKHRIGNLKRRILAGRGSIFDGFLNQGNLEKTGGSGNNPKANHTFKRVKKSHQHKKR
jgi:hypothetical protein